MTLALSEFLYKHTVYIFWYSYYSLGYGGSFVSVELTNKSQMLSPLSVSLEIICIDLHDILVPSLLPHAYYPHSCALHDLLKAMAEDVGSMGLCISAQWYHPCMPAEYTNNVLKL